MTPKELEHLCAKWPGVTFDIKWGADFVCSVAGKMFAATGTNGGGISFKVPDDLFLAITEQPGIIPAPYAARFKWVMVKDPTRHSRKWLENNIRISYELVRAKLSKKVRERLEPVMRFTIAALPPEIAPGKARVPRLADCK